MSVLVGSRPPYVNAESFERRTTSATPTLVQFTERVSQAVAALEAV
ncbi:MAG TPA: hypothetical protein VN757_06450 [Steroidobacteraceae bacterium]|nr:hypothetical protein [Steroidobacteraceae bacterium]